MNRRSVILSLLLALFLAITLTASAASDPAVETDGTIDMVWPEPPEITRIKYVRQFSNAQGLGLKKSFSRKLQNAIAGREDRTMVRPYAVAVDGSRVAVADPGAAIVHLFDTGKKAYKQLNKAGKIDFASPIGVALSKDRIYVADSELNKVFILNQRYKLLLTLEGFQRPTSLAYDPTRQRLYVADTLAHEVWVFDQKGKALFTIGERGEADAQFNFPSHIAFANDLLIVNDTMNFRVQIFDPEGQHLRTFGKHGVGSGHFTQPKGVAADTQGHIYVADAMSNQVQIFNQDGTFLLGFGEAGDSPGAFQMPTGLAIWDDMIYVTDSYNQRVQVFQYLPEVH